MFAILRNCVTLALVIGAMVVQAPALANTFGGMNPVDNQRLDHIRGGFSIQYELGQLKLAMNVTRISSINGSIVTEQHLTGASGGTLSVIQSGLNNMVSSSVVSSIPTGMLGTVIQNNLDNQVIRAINVLNITLTSQALAQAMAVRAITQSALLQSIH